VGELTKARRLIDGASFGPDDLNTIGEAFDAREHDRAADDKVVCVPKPASPQHLVATVEGLLRSRPRAN
jgi:hypothetical protein